MGLPRIWSAPFSPIMIVGAFRLPVVIDGITGFTGGINITSSVIAGNTATTGAGLDISFGSGVANATFSAIGTDALAGAGVASARH